MLSSIGRRLTVHAPDAEVQTWLRHAIDLADGHLEDLTDAQLDELLRHDGVDAEDARHVLAQLLAMWRDAAPRARFRVAPKRQTRQRRARSV